MRPRLTAALGSGPECVLLEDISNKVVVSAVKGIIPETGLLVGEHFHDHYNISFENIGVIAGPCHAEEVALEPRKGFF